MNPALLLTFSGVTKRQILFVIAMLAVITMLPVMAVFSLGTSALELLFGSSGDPGIDAISTTTQGMYEGPAVPGDTYAWGNCTYWAFALRLQASDPIPTSWGNANTWALNARLQGYVVDNTPSVGAVMQTSAGDLGHVAYVTAVDPTTGDWTISEMNVKGLDVVDVATYPASADKDYNFIHDKATLPGVPVGLSL